MPLVEIDGRTIADWRSFHEQSAHVFGFPDFYGKNMNAWVDCLTYVRDGDGMSKFTLGAEQQITIEVTHARTFQESAPEVFSAFLAAIADVNRRQLTADERPALLLLLS